MSVNICIISANELFLSFACSMTWHTLKLDQAFLCCILLGSLGWGSLVLLVEERKLIGNVEIAILGKLPVLLVHEDFVTLFLGILEMILVSPFDIIVISSSCR